MLSLSTHVKYLQEAKGQMNSATEFGQAASVQKKWRRF
jgi:hypothetical protein